MNRLGTSIINSLKTLIRKLLTLCAVLLVLSYLFTDRGLAILLHGIPIHIVFIQYPARISRTLADMNSTIWEWLITLFFVFVTIKIVIFVFKYIFSTREERYIRGIIAGFSNLELEMLRSEVNDTKLPSFTVFPPRKGTAEGYTISRQAETVDQITRRGGSKLSASKGRELVKVLSLVAAIEGLGSGTFQSGSEYGLYCKILPPLPSVTTWAVRTFKEDPDEDFCCEVKITPGQTEYWSPTKAENWDDFVRHGLVLWGIIAFVVFTVWSMIFR